MIYVVNLDSFFALKDFVENKILARDEVAIVIRDPRLVAQFCTEVGVCSQSFQILIDSLKDCFDGTGIVIPTEKELMYSLHITIKGSALFYLILSH